MSFSAGRVVTATVLLGLVVAAGAAGPAAAQDGGEATVMHVSLQPSGDAQWTVSVRFVLEDQNETAAFDRLADEFVTGESAELNADPFRTAADLAGDATGREMTVRDVARSASRANGSGELRLSFTWENFTRVEDGGERLVLGDVFATPSGTWLPALEANQVLVIEFPGRYSIQSSSRPLENESIRVTGPATFQPGEPSATLVRSESVPTPTPSGFGVPSALTAGAALAVLLGVAFLLYRRRQVEPEDEPDEGITAEPDEEPDGEVLLSDEERVLRLLQAEGGRMKQVDIVDETDWSNAKVSQLLSSMAEEGHIEKLRIGRENLISLPDEGDE
jgi:hypothetical protein